MEDMNQKVTDFLKNLERQGIKKIIAFSGGADLEEKISEIVEQSMDTFKGLPIAVLTGGTAWGLPKYATETAKKIWFSRNRSISPKGCKICA